MVEDCGAWRLRSLKIQGREGWIQLSGHVGKRIQRIAPGIAYKYQDCVGDCDGDVAYAQKDPIYVVLSAEVARAME
ncbi:hypothetical protein PHLCEN_2v1502 [Hermanssonia centrifuga]|uniref:Uncharacterized protein n=1 Tax=Hermanssonia centrifuga TaxID=98765 RepID=A0A2R6RZY2_9APHY|nr:hypothetical protein PHLCEN_2v1502 [Hermanssonia centrifuga]